MKRKAAISADAQMSESGAGTGPQSKKRRVRSGFLGDVSCSAITSAAAETRKARDGGGRKKVTVHKVIDLLENEDGAAEEKVQVLQEKDPNTLASVPSCSPLVSPLVRPGPALPDPGVTNLEMDADSSSYLDPGGDESLGLMPESIFLYSPSPAVAGPRRDTLARICSTRCPQKLSSWCSDGCPSAPWPGWPESASGGCC